MEELSLRSYDWIHSRAEYRQLWDFSRLRGLELENKFRGFIDQSLGVQPSDLPKLESLKIHGWGFDDEEVEDLELGRRDMTIFLGGLAKLKKLKIEFQ